MEQPMLGFGFGFDFDGAQLPQETIEEVICQVENDDPQLVELDLGRGRVVPRYGDWGGLGTDIGRNTHLRKLTLYHVASEFIEGDLERFFRGVACNRSIQNLSFNPCNHFGGEIFRIVRPLFERNQVECLESWGIKHDTRKPAFSRREFDSLKEFGLFGCRVDGNGMEDVIRALAGHSGLRKLFLKCTSLKRNACVALASLLQRSNSKLGVLNLFCCQINDERAAILATGLTGNNTLNDLNLNGNSITEVGWRAIFAALQNPSFEKLNEIFSGVNDASRLCIFRQLTNNITLKSLDLSSCLSITNIGWRAFFVFLQDQTCALEKLDFSRNGFNNNRIISLANALLDNSSLRNMNISHNPEITSTGWRAFSSVLQDANPALLEVDVSNTGINDEAIDTTGWEVLTGVIESPLSALEKIDLRFNSINDNTLISFANSLASNIKLKELIIYPSNNTITANGWGAFSRVLCNTSSIIDTYDSNHTLQKLSHEENMVPQQIRSLLEFNRDDSKRQAARLKIIKTYFSGDFSVQPFVRMEWNILPHAIAWTGRDGKIGETNGHLYELVKVCRYCLMPEEIPTVRCER